MIVLESDISLEVFLITLQKKMILSGAVMSVLLIVIFLIAIFPNFVNSPVKSVQVEVVVVGETIELNADFSQLSNAEDAILYLYTPNAYYSLGKTTSDRPILGNDLRKTELKNHIVKEYPLEAENIGNFLSIGITHPGKSKTTFHLQKRIGESAPEKYRVYIVTYVKRWFKDDFHIEETFVHSGVMFE